MEKHQRSPLEHQQHQHGDDGEAEELMRLLQTLPKARNWHKYYDLYMYQNFWCPSIFFNGIVRFQNHFRARDSDIILASCPKSGSTWLKALIFSIANRQTADAVQDGSPTLTCGVHELIPFLEIDFYQKSRCPAVEDLTPPRIFATHVPFRSLPHSIKGSNCKIVYICRNPLDMFVSYWHFIQRLCDQNAKPPLSSLEEALNLFCHGIFGYGPFWDHVLGYWSASLERPERILFMKYEDMKKDLASHIKRLAEFMGFPFMASTREEEEGRVEEIIKSCGFDNMRNAHKSGMSPAGAPNDAFFRKGEVGDWANHLTPDMADRLMKVVNEQLDGSGLIFETKLKSNAKTTTINPQAM